MAVVIPARDEEGTHAAGPASSPQLRDGDTCVVVDDESSDATAAVAEAAGAPARPAGPRPDGWTGKAWACARGADALEARACDVLVFLDADVRLDGHDVLDRLAAEVATAPQALVSVQPWHRTVRPVEQLSVFFNITAPMGSTGFTALGRRVRCSLAFGPVLAHPGGVRGGRWARPSKRPRRRGRGHRARPTLPSREPPHGAAGRQLPHVPGRAAGAGPGVDEEHRDRRGQRPVVVRPARGGMAVVPERRLDHIAVVLRRQRRAGPVLGRRAGRFGVLTALAYPLLVLFFLVVFLRSLALTALRRPVRWKGRLVATR